jgi:hypothetical protein
MGGEKSLGIASKFAKGSKRHGDFLGGDFSAFVRYEKKELSDTWSCA